MRVLSAHPFLIGSGAVLIVIGVALRRWASRHDLEGLAFDAAWHVARNRGDLSKVGETDIAQRLGEVASQPSNVGRARKVAGVATRHFVAQIANIAALLALLAGLLMVVVAIYLGA